MDTRTDAVALGDTASCGATEASVHRTVVKVHNNGLTLEHACNLTAASRSWLHHCRITQLVTDAGFRIPPEAGQGAVRGHTRGLADVSTYRRIVASRVASIVRCGGSTSFSVTSRCSPSLCSTATSNEKHSQSESCAVIPVFIIPIASMLPEHRSERRSCCS